MSSKGQIVIPEAIRKQLNLEEGSQFIVVGEGDVVILKAITAPSLESFEAFIIKSMRTSSNLCIETRGYCQRSCEIAWKT